MTAPAPPPAGHTTLQAGHAPEELLTIGGGTR
jgi:hypothetical protein